MAGTKVQIKRSSVAGRVPSTADIAVGELAVNFTDKRFFTKDTTNTVIEVFGQSLNTTANVSFRDGAFANITATTLAGNLEWSYITSKPDLKISITGDAVGNATFIDLANGSIDIILADTAVTPGTYGNSSVVPVITVDSKGRITSATTNAVAGITGYSYTAANNTFAITAGDGSVYKATIDTVNALSVSSNLVVTGVGEFANDVNITGNLTVLGTTSFVNTTQVNIGDNIIVLNANTTATPLLDAGIEIERGTSPNVSLLWDETADAWTYTNDGTTYQQIFGNTDFESALLDIVAGYSNAASNAYSNAVSTAATDATNKAANAYSNAVSFATNAAANAYSNAISFATNAAANAYSNAVSHADTAAATAYSNAVSDAATDASAKAAAAYSNATSYADTVAAAAFTNAAAYAASNTYVNDNFAKLSGAVFTGPISGVTTLAAGNTTIAGYVNTDTGFIVSGTGSRVLTANAGGIWPNSNTAAMYLGDATKRWEYVYANAGSFSANVDIGDTLSVNNKVTSTYATISDTISTRTLSSQGISADDDLTLIPGATSANGVVIRGFRDGFSNTNLKIENSGVATFANTIVAPTIFVGNSTVNATVNSTAFALNGVPIGGSGSADTAYANATAYADTVATTAYNNAVMAAINQGANAYANAVSYADTKAAAAFANAISYANATFAPIISPAFTGTVHLPAVMANGSLGTAGQVLATTGDNTYWTTVSSGGSFTNGQSISVANLVVVDTTSLLKVSAGGSLGSVGQVLTTDGGNVYWSTVTSGTNTFNKIAVAGQSNVVADSLTDTLTLVAGDNITITTDASTDSITISSTASGSGSSGNNAGNAFISGRDNFVGDGTTATFTLSHTASSNSILVLAEGLVQFHNEDYDVIGTSLTFATAPANNEHIEVIHIAGASTYHFMEYSAIDVFTGNGSNTAYTLSRSANTHTATVYLDGLLQAPTTDFSISGSALTFTAAPLSGETVLIYHIESAASAIPGAAISSADVFAGDGTTTNFTMSGAANTSTIMVTINGLLQGYTTEYTVSDTTLTFDSAPPNGSVVQAVRLVGSVGMAFDTISVGNTTLTAAGTNRGVVFANTSGINLQANNNTITISAPDIAKQSLTGDGTTNSFVLLCNATSDDIFVYVNGIYFHPDEDYAVSGTTITFTTAPIDTSDIRIRFMRAPNTPSLLSLIGDLSTGSGSYDLETMTGGSVDLSA